MRRCLPIWRRCSMGSPALSVKRAQGPRDEDHRQADERRRIVARELVEERDAESFALEATRAVDGGFGCDVARDLVRAEGAKAYPRDIHVLCREPRLETDEGDGGVEQHLLARQLREHGFLRRVAAGLAEALVAECADLVRADHDRPRFALGDELGLGEGETGGERGRGLERAAGLIERGRDAFEGQLQALEQGPSVAGTRGETERPSEKKQGLISDSF